MLKLYNWEAEFQNRILEAREEEMVIIRKLLRNSIYNIFFYWIAPVIVSMVTIGVYQYLNTTLDIANILTGLTIINMLQPALRDLPISINSVLEILFSLKRIEVKIF